MNELFGKLRAEMMTIRSRVTRPVRVAFVADTARYDETLAEVRELTAGDATFRVFSTATSSDHSALGTAVDCKELLSFSPDIIVVCDDANKAPLLHFLNGCAWSHFPAVVVYGSAHQDLLKAKLKILESALEEPSHALGYSDVKAHIYQILRYLRDAGATGTIVELGVYRGGTLLLIQAMLRDLAYTIPDLVGFDTFNGFPPRKCFLDLYDSPDFANKDWDHTNALANRHGIRLIRGDITDTVDVLKDANLLLTFVDTDNFSPAKVALPICWGRTVVGGAIVMDHFYTEERFVETIGERLAAEEFFRTRPEALNLHGTGVFIRMR